MGEEDSDHVNSPVSGSLLTTYTQSKVINNCKRQNELKSRSTSPLNKKIKLEDMPEFNSNTDDEDDPDKLWCLCQQKHNNRFMIQCDDCKNWFHGSCVKISKRQGRRMEKQNIDWFCQNCVSRVNVGNLCNAKFAKLKIYDIFQDLKHRNNNYFRLITENIQEFTLRFTSDEIKSDLIDNRVLLNKINDYCKKMFDASDSVNNAKSNEVPLKISCDDCQLEFDTLKQKLIRSKFTKV